SKCTGYNEWDADNKMPKPLHILEVLQFRPAATPARTHRKGEAAKMVQGGALYAQRGHGGYLGRDQFLGKSVFFGDLRITPAPGAVELQHHLFHIAHGGFEVHLVHAVLEAVERGHAP